MVNKERSGGVPAVDLQSVKLTLEYIYGDVKDVGQLRKVALALKSAIQEIEAVGGRRVDARFERLVSLARGPAAPLSRLSAHSGTAFNPALAVGPPGFAVLTGCQA